ncbi:MAG: ribosome recycling factor [Acidobacteriota bacterium]
MIKDLISETRARMGKTVEDLTVELTSVRTGRASIHLLDHVRVDYYGTPTPINQVATLHVPEPTLITVQPWDTTQLANIERALAASNLGINPSNDGRLIRLPIPPLTEERRRTLARHVGTVAEEHRTAIRNIRRDANDKLKQSLKEKEISEDDEFRALAEVQQVTDEYVRKIDKLAAQKEKEILEV